MGATEDHVISLCEQILGPARRRATFNWAQGDVSATTGRTRALPFDAAWDQLKLIVEVNENQHRAPEPLFDKPHVLTVSGVHRGEQRRIYDDRKRRAAAENGFTVVDLDWSRRRNPGPGDLDEVRERLRAAGVLPG